MAATTRTTPTVDTTSSRTDLITMLLAAWLMIGLFLDGYAHANIIDELESFFTPWHGVFYSGFLATAGWIGFTVYRRMEGGRTFREAIPPGYGLSVAGALVFAAGGVGDGIWHTLFGIETGLDALLSPTHLLLFLGLIMILTTPIRTARIRNPGTTIDKADRAVVIMGFALTTALVGFMFEYLWITGQPWVAEELFSANTGRGQSTAVFGVAALLITNLVLMTPVAYALKLWRPPTGLITAVWLTVNVLVALAFSWALQFAVVISLVGGLTGDVLVKTLNAGPDRRNAAAVVLSATPFVAWGAWFAMIAIVDFLRWPPEIWGGAMLFASMSGLGLAALALPERTVAIGNNDPT